MIRKKDDNKDPRITAPLISWRILLFIIAIVFLILLTAGFIYDEFLDNIDTLATILIYYTVIVCLLLAMFVGVLWRNLIGKPVRKVAKAARRVAKGDFSVQIPENNRKDGSKNEIDVMIDDFNTMVKQLKGNEILKNDFIANVSHEMKTPLSVILSYVKALRDNRVPEDQREKYMEIVIATSEKLSAMITNILKLSKLENQQIFPIAKEYQLGEQLRRCALELMDEWQGKEIEFYIDVEDIVVRYDEALLDSVWSNLLSNAIKFTDRGGKISLTSRKEGGAIKIRLSDTGCGMDEETKTRLYEKFYQGDTSHSSEGNGLGLALVKRILDVTGGAIEVESEQNKGTMFTVTLPL